MSPSLRHVRKANALPFQAPRPGPSTQRDPIGLAGGINQYGYAGGDPVNFSDPFGLCPPRDTNVTDCTVILNGATVSNPKLLARLQEFAQHIGRDISLNGRRSGDRSLADNAGVGGRSASPHLTNEGADIHVAGTSNLDLAHQAVESGLFNGVGYYENSCPCPPGYGPHAHVDVKDRGKETTTTWWVDSKRSTKQGLPEKTK